MYFRFCFKVFILQNILFHHIKGFSDECQKTIKDKSEGTIKNPEYGIQTLSPAPCFWVLYNKPNHMITLSFDEINIEESTEMCLSYPCCTYNWLKVITKPNDYQTKFCGATLPPPIITTASKVVIKYHVSHQTAPQSKFQISYFIGPIVSQTCKANQFHCSNFKCIPQSWECNGRDECGDGSDELNCGIDSILCPSGYRRCHDLEDCYKFPEQQCDGKWNCINRADELGCESNKLKCPRNTLLCKNGKKCYFPYQLCDGIVDCDDYSDELECQPCGPFKILCSQGSPDCFDPLTQLCDRVLNCQNGADEKNCTSHCYGKIPCAFSKDCYSWDQRCDGIPKCEDYSDEKNCDKTMCKPERGGFLCNNLQCIQELWKCDGTDDCGDASDEINCIRNSVITAAIIGSLTCGLLLVIALKCTFKLFLLRDARSESRRETPLSRLNDEICWFREPPPPYSMLCPPPPTLQPPVSRQPSRTIISQEIEPPISTPLPSVEPIIESGASTNTEPLPEREPSLKITESFDDPSSSDECLINCDTTDTEPLLNI